MSKAIDATCQAGVVTADGVTVPGTTVLSQGVGASAGVLVLDEEKKFYIPKTSPDLDATLAQVIAGLNAAATGLTATAGALTSLGQIAPGVAVTAAAASITSASGLLATLKGQLL
jgi:hypothetical protein